MSIRSRDRLALVVGVPLLLAGLVDLADRAGALDAGAWLLVPALILAGAAGLVASLMSFRVTATGSDSGSNGGTVGRTRESEEASR